MTEHALIEVLLSLGISINAVADLAGVDLSEYRATDPIPDEILDYAGANFLLA